MVLKTPNKHFKRNKNSWLGSASLHILTNYFCPLKWALGYLSMSRIKFSSIDNTKHQHGDLIEHKCHDEWSVVVAAPNSNQIDLVLDLCKNWSGRFGVLYVLVVPRCGHEEGRYQSNRTFTYIELREFLHLFKGYFEKDGRHHIWVIDVETNNRIVYDNHDLIHCYGDDESAINTCVDLGLAFGEINIPSPHQHLYNKCFDVSENEIFEQYDWQRFPLVSEHDNP